MENLQLNDSNPRIVPNKSSIGGKLLIGITGGVGIGLSIICLPFVTPALRRVCLPYVPATDAQIKNVLCALKNRSGKLLDIGSGDGRIVVSAAKSGFIAHGVELNPWLVQYSRFNAILNKVNSNTSFFRRDLWKFDLRPYENIVIFGVEEMMDDLEKKIKAEVNIGATVVACRFPFKNMEPDKIIGNGIDTVWQYQLQK